MSAPTEQSSDQWWFCLRHSRAESDPDCPHSDRLGPYPTRAAAEQALQSAGDKSQAWDEDLRWKDDR